MIRVERQHPAQLGTELLGTAVVIDVLRATSTATVLIGRGAGEILVAATPADLVHLPLGVNPLILSELPEASAFGERIDNSPTLAAQVSFEGRTLVLVTTNGTRALDAANGRADRVLIASFLNLAATAQALRELAPDRVTLLPAGKFDPIEERTEDELCAQALTALLAGRPVDLATMVTRIREDPHVLERLTEEHGLAVDVDVVLKNDLYPVVIEFQRAGLLGRIVRSMG